MPLPYTILLYGGSGRLHPAHANGGRAGRLRGAGRRRQPGLPHSTEGLFRAFVRSDGRAETNVCNTVVE